MDRDPSIEPDTKDWTWVLDRPCAECGLDATSVHPTGVAEMLRRNADGWLPVLRRPDAGTRPSAGVWSPVEYACHVRDVHRVFAGRVRLMRDVDDPLFDNWDQDAAAVAGAYGKQRPAEVGEALVAAAGEAAAAYGTVHGADWDRPGRRSNGSVFTVASLARYHLHDVVHHLTDVGAGQVR
jgi:DinB superfamily